ncbi:MAG: class II aldolase/adducin family protein [Eubacterium sp.]|nr:class II aldolase/adducin family protein [Eubacterium sp.]
MMNLSYYEMRCEMATVAKIMYDRKLTNAAGGNFAVRVDENRILLSPSMMSENKHCMLKPEDFLLIDYDQNILEGTGKLSRETLMHVLILKNFKEIGCVIHAHPFYCMPYVAFGKPIPNVTEATMGRGMVEVIPWQQAYSEELSVGVYKYWEEHRELAVKKPIAGIMQYHGVVCSGDTIYKAFSMLERIDVDAFCNLSRAAVMNTDMTCIPTLK